MQKFIGSAVKLNSWCIVLVFKLLEEKIALIQRSTNKEASFLGEKKCK